MEAIRFHGCPIIRRRAPTWRREVKKISLILLSLCMALIAITGCSKQQTPTATTRVATDTPLHIDGSRAKAYNSVQQLTGDSLAVVRVTATPTRTVESVGRTPFTVTTVKSIKSCGERSAGQRSRCVNSVARTATLSSRIRPPCSNRAVHTLSSSSGSRLAPARKPINTFLLVVQPDSSAIKMARYRNLIPIRQIFRPLSRWRICRKASGHNKPIAVSTSSGWPRGAPRWVLLSRSRANILMAE